MEAKRLSEASLRTLFEDISKNDGERIAFLLSDHIAALDAEIQAAAQEREAIGVRLAQIKDLEKENKRPREREIFYRELESCLNEGRKISRILNDLAELHTPDGVTPC